MLAEPVRAWWRHMPIRVLATCGARFMTSLWRFVPALVAIGVAYGFYAIAQSYTTWQERLARVGVPGEVEIISKSYYDPGPSTDRRPQNRRYLITYRLVSNRGETVDNTATLDRSEYDKLNKGDRLRVTYDPAEPRLLSFDTLGLLVWGKTQIAGGADWIFSALAAAAGCFAAVWTIWKATGPSELRRR